MMRKGVSWHVLAIILAVLLLVIGLLIIAKMKGIGGELIDKMWGAISFLWPFK